MGLSTVHVNRSLSRLSKERLLKIEKGMVTFPEVSRSIRFADFDERFLMEFVTKAEGVRSNKRIS